MKQTNYTINEFGEIIREDYFATSVKGTVPQPLPTNRKVWKMFLLSIITLGIYNFVIIFAMAKETNISCAEDGKHTRNLWATIGLSIITLGIYAIVWWWKWFDREYNYLERNSPNGGILTGGGYFMMVLVSWVLNIGMQLLPMFVSPYQAETYLLIFGVLFISLIIWGIFMMSKWVKQHNTVNKNYNLRTFGTKEF